MAARPEAPRIYQEDYAPAADGYRLRYRRYPAPEPARLAVACFHGIQSHAGWYTRSCQRLAERGCTTFFFDRRGSGANREYPGHASGPGQLCDDLFRCVARVREREPGSPVFLLAISWGAKIAALALKKRPDLVEGIVFVCPGWFATVSPPFREKLAIGWSALLWPRRRLPIPLADPALFTGTPAMQQVIREDPHALRSATARLLFTSRLLDRAIADAPQRISTPSLLLLARQDRIIDNRRTREYFGRFAGKQNSVVEFDAHHTLEFEPDPTPIFQTTADWLLAQRDRLAK